MSHDSAPIGPRLFTDGDVRRLDPAWSVNVMTDAVRAHAEGRLAAPARASADVTLTSTGRSRGKGANGAGGADTARDPDAASPGRIVMTAGRTREWFGYRVYDTIATTRGEQVVIAHDGATGDVRAIAVGSELGAYRTGALGGVAMRTLGPSPESGSVRAAVIGAGRQAWTQLWAATGVLDIDDVRVVSRTSATVEAFCQRAIRAFGMHCAPADSVRDAVRGADVVILATTSSVPVIDAAWLEPDCVVVTLGPKQEGRAEFGLDLLDGAFVTTDSPAQLHAYDPPALASEHLADHAVVALGDLVTGRVEPLASGRRVHLSVGLAGTEVALLAAMAAAREGGVSASGVGGG